MCVYECMCVCVYACMYVCMYVCVYMHMYVCMCVCMYVRMCVCMWSYCNLIGQLESVDYEPVPGAAGKPEIPGEFHLLLSIVCMYVCMYVCVYVCMLTNVPYWDDSGNHIGLGYQTSHTYERHMC